MLNIVKGCAVVVSCSIPVDLTLSIPQRFQTKPLICKEYKSPTLNYNPIEQYEGQQLNNLIEKIFIQNE